MDKKQLEARYIQVKADIKAHMTMIKMYADSIQKSRSALDDLSAELSALQIEYEALTKGEEKDEQTSTEPESSDSE